jgi:hypothetical protein
MRTTLYRCGCAPGSSAKRAELESQLLDQRSALVRSDYASTKVKADVIAIKVHMIPLVQYEQIQIALKQLQQRVQIEQLRVAAFAASMKASLGVAQESRCRRLESDLFRAPLGETLFLSPPPIGGDTSTAMNGALATAEIGNWGSEATLCREQL